MSSLKSKLALGLLLLAGLAWFLHGQRQERRAWAQQMQALTNQLARQAQSVSPVTASPPPSGLSFTPDDAYKLSLHLEPTRSTNDVRYDATVAAIERALPSIVNVATESPLSIRDPFEEQFQQFLDRVYGRTRPTKGISIGSGVIIDEGGYLLTNDHVVRRANQIQIQLVSSREVYTATVIGHDSEKDLALLKINAPPGTKFTAIKFAADDDVLLGETVLALGNPLGLGGSVSRGIISAKDRAVSLESEGGAKVAGLLQTDAAINPGNSGGALVNLRGELVGINSAIREDARGISFAISTKQVNEALATAFTPESVRQLWFGARVKAGGGPLVITDLEADSPASLAGLKLGDTILEVNGQTPRNFVGYNEMLASITQSNVQFTIARNGETKAVKVLLIPEQNFFNNDLLQRRLGITVQPITPELAAARGLLAFSGFVVLSADAEAGASGVQTNDVITSADGKVIENLVGLSKLVYRKDHNAPVQLGIIHQQNLQQGLFAQGIVTTSRTIQLSTR